MAWGFIVLPFVIADTPEAQFGKKERHQIVTGWPFPPSESTTIVMPLSVGRVGG
jgi:hypothetical protein